MANLTETSTWESGIYQVEKVDKWDAGTGGNGVANLREKQLANRTLYLKDEILSIRNRVHVYVEFANRTVSNNSVINADGSSYVIDFPLSQSTYTTPNDGITRNYIATIGCLVGTGFTYTTGGAFTMSLRKSIAGPTVVFLEQATSFNPGQTIMTQKKLTIAPNEVLCVSYILGNVGHNVAISNAFFRLEEIIE
jgi:hypothetical protein